LIVCTHWHDDHIQGISQILEESKNAKFSFAHANDRKKFLQFVKLDFEKITFEASNSSTVEFSKCLDILEGRRQPIVLASADKILASFNLDNGLKTDVISLSPSDFTSLEFDKEISTLITEYGISSKKVIPRSPNAKSVVLFLKLGHHRALLGADLEVSRDGREGWVSILDNSNVIDLRASLFKIPHHGSENGYHQRVWLQLLTEQPIAKLTPWNKNGKLPEVKMLKKYHNHTSELFLTSLVFNEKPKKRDKNTDKLIRKLKCKIREVKFERGIIRCSIDLNDINATWNVEVLENSHKVDNDYLQ
jgi:hypothetical protein